MGILILALTSGTTHLRQPFERTGEKSLAYQEASIYVPNLPAEYPVRQLDRSV